MPAAISPSATAVTRSTNTVTRKVRSIRSTYSRRIARRRTTKRQSTMSHPTLMRMPASTACGMGSAIQPNPHRRASRRSAARAPAKWTASSGPNAGDGAHGRPRSGQSAHHARRQVAETLAHEFSIGVVMGIPCGMVPIVRASVRPKSAMQVPATRATSGAGRKRRRRRGQNMLIARATTPTARSCRPGAARASGHAATWSRGPPGTGSAPRNVLTCRTMMIAPIPVMKPETTE